MDENEIAALIDSLCDRLRMYYVFPEVAERICACLRDLDGAARIGAPDPAAVVKQLNELMRRESADQHLRVRWFADPAALAADPHQGDAEVRHRAAADDQFGIVRCEVIGQRLGLLAISEFHAAEFMRQPLAAAMARLSGCTALVVDLRQCRGGEPDAVALLSGYLFPPSPVHLNDLYLRRDNRTLEFWTEPQPGSKFATTPVFVLTSAATFSAGEEFAYNLQALGRAKIVGETTRGGAHPGDIHRLTGGFAVFIPDARAINPVTGTNWEGCGVRPDVACRADDAEEMVVGWVAG